MTARNSSTRRPHGTHLTAWAAAVGLLLTLTGCGSGDGGEATSSSSSSSSSTTTQAPPKASELYTQARKTALAARSGHVQGTITDDGDTISIDLAGTVDGSNQSLELGQGDAKITILTVKGTYYLSATEEFWKQQLGGAQAKSLVNKFVKVPPSEVKQFGDFTLKSLIESIFEDKGMSALQSANAKVTRTTVDGAPAWEVTDKVGGDGAKIVVSADGKATLLKITGPKDDPGEVLFSEWDEVNPVDAPAPSKVIDPPTS